MSPKGQALLVVNSNSSTQVPPVFPANWQKGITIAKSYSSYSLDPSTVALLREQLSVSVQLVYAPAAELSSMLNVFEPLAPEATDK
jgi:hypothetical protein